MIEFREAHLDHEMPAVTRQLWDQKDRKNAEPVEIDLPTLSQHELHVGLRDTGTALIVGLFSGPKNETPEGWMELRRGTNHLLCNTANILRESFSSQDSIVGSDAYFSRLVIPALQASRGLRVGYSTKAFQGLGIGKWLVGLSCQLARLDGKKEITFMNCNTAAQELINKSGVTVIDIMTGRTREEKTITISHF